MSKTQNGPAQAQPRNTQPNPPSGGPRVPDRSRGSAIKIGKKAFIMAAAIILLLMIASGVLTKVLPAGTFDRVV